MDSTVRARKGPKPKAERETMDARTRVLMDRPWRFLPHTMAMHLSGGKWLPYNYLMFLSHLIAALVSRGNARIIVEIPPRHGKSLFISYWVPVWFLSNWPDENVILSTYEANFAASWGRKVRNTLKDKSEELGVYIKQDTSAAAYWQTTAGGGMMTAGVGGPITGKGAKLCFPAGTMVITNKGRTDIAELYKDYSTIAALSFCRDRRRLVWRRIVAAQKKEYSGDVIEMTSMSGRVLQATGGHPIYDVWLRDYRAAREFRVGDVIRTDHHDCSISELKVTWVSGMEVYDIQVDGTNNFFANGILVHNCLIDDPHKNWKEAVSGAVCRSIQEWYDSTFYTRLEPDGSIIILHTRWTENDLIGYCLRDHADENWTVVRFPAIAEEDDVLGRKEGEALCPERYNRKALTKIKGVLSSQMWNGLYQQRPSAMEGEMWLRSRWKYYKEPPRCSYVIQSWDTGFKKGEHAAYSVCQTWGVFEHGFALLDQWRDRVEYPELEKMAKLQFAAVHPHAVLIEDKASGQSLIQSLRRDSPHIPVIAVDPQDDGSKEMRALAVTPMHESGMLWLPDPIALPDYGWVKDMVERFVVFPNGVYKDEIDAASQALSHLRDYSSFSQVLTGSPRSSGRILTNFRQELESLGIKL